MWCMQKILQDKYQLPLHEFFSSTPFINVFSNLAKITTLFLQPFSEDLFGYIPGVLATKELLQGQMCKIKQTPNLTRKAEY